MKHDPSGVDVYVTDFERVYQLHRDGKSPEQIVFLTGLSASVVREYRELIEVYGIADLPERPHTGRRTKRITGRAPASVGTRSVSCSTD
jgi:hypothetical protein